MEHVLAVAVIFYICIILGLAIFAKKKVRNETDFLAAGRRLPVIFASATLFATWFGAGTLLTATDAIYEHGFSITALEPFGAGSCLLIAGLFFAAPLWKMKILTVPDLFRQKFGFKAELISAVLLVPGYFGWIAVQITALGGIINLFFGVHLTIAMIVLTAFATLLAVLGGMWSVTLTDLVQMIFVLMVIAILAYVVLAALGHGELSAGMTQWWTHAQEIKITDTRSFGSKLFLYLNVFTIAALGNLPGQDLAQRVNSSKSANVAARSCIIAGIFYIVFGSISILLGIAARGLLPEPVSHSVIPHLAQHLLSPGLTALLVLAIISVILSTMDSAMLATASIIAHNLLRPYCAKHNLSLITACRACIVFVAALSLSLAFVGESAYNLLEQSYAISLVGLFAPFAIGLFSKRGHEQAAIISMLVGMSWWVLGFFVESFFFSELMALAGSFLAYVVVTVLATKFSPNNISELPKTT